MPKFTEVKRWIREAASEIGFYLPEMQAKALAGAWMTAYDDDPALRYSVLTYADSTGEQAVKTWFKEKAA